MQLHNLKRQHPRQRQKIVGRGGKRGTTAGRGTKGQRARSGHRIRPEIRDVIKRLPKKRGYRFRPKVNKIVAVTLENIARCFAAGLPDGKTSEIVSPKTLAAKRLVPATIQRHGQVKIIGQANLTQTLTVQDCLITASAQKAIEQAGGKYVK